MRVEVRRIAADEVDAWVRSVSIPFLSPADDDSNRHWRLHVEPDRAWAAVDGGRFVGNCCVFSRDVTVPGCPGEASPTVSLTAVSGVGVHPTHRRQGLLRRMMGAMLADGRAHGETVAGLLASEAAIYGRFGFGWASTGYGVALDRAAGTVVRKAPDLDLLLCGADEAAGLVPALYDRLRLLRAGQVDRNQPYWDDTWTDPPARRPSGASARFYAIGEDGYVAYRAANDWPSADPTTLYVDELLGTSGEVEAGLWQYLLGVDLVQRLVAQQRPVDEALRWRLADPRALQVTSLDDQLWLRILDVPGALTARRYQADGRLVLEVDPAEVSVDEAGHRTPDPAAGRWVLEVGPDGASCRPAGPAEPSELRLGVAELSAAFLGGHELSVAGAAGRVEEVRPGALARADALFGTRPLPFSSTGF